MRSKFSNTGNDGQDRPKPTPDPIPPGDGT